MKAEYWPELDLLNVTFAEVPSRVTEGEEVRRGIVLLFDEDGRLAEIEIEQAGRRIDMEEMKRPFAFEERREREKKEQAI